MACGFAWICEFVHASCSPHFYSGAVKKNFKSSSGTLVGPSPNSYSLSSYKILVTLSLLNDDFSKNLNYVVKRRHNRSEFWLLGPVLRSRLEPSLLGQLQSWSWFLVCSDPGAGATFFKAAPAAFFRKAKKISPVLASNMTLRAVQKGKYGIK